jgi:hypothetical protein
MLRSRKLRFPLMLFLAVRMVSLACVRVRYFVFVSNLTTRCAQSNRLDFIPELYIKEVCIIWGSRNDAVGIAIDYRLDDGGVKNFPSSTAPRPALWLT